MSEYFETFYDPDFGAITVVRDGEGGPIIATGADGGRAHE